MSSNSPNGGESNGAQEEKSLPLGKGTPSKGPLGGADDDHQDGRKRGDWKSIYKDDKALKAIKFEATVLAGILAALIFIAGISVSLVNQHYTFILIQGDEASQGTAASVNFSLLAIFFVGCVGGVTFSIKWLIHAVAKGKWHLDRRLWRFFVPFTGGVYACVVMTLYDAGLFHGPLPNGADPTGHALTLGLAFLVGYFSDGVSGLLSNIANAVFGTVEKK